MPYRILSLDGGGIRGTLAAQILEGFEKLVDQPLHEYFDLIAGTSTGSIIATGIASKKSARNLLDLYRKNGNRIFPYSGTWGYFNPRRFKLVLQKGLSAPKFSHDGLIEVLKEQFGATTTLGEITPTSESPGKLLITSYDTITRRPTVFKSWRHEMWYTKIPAWELCVCSASAPTFFPAYRIPKPGGKEFSGIDGGVSANNPVCCALAEAVRLGNDLRDISVFSIGTGDVIKPITYEDAKNWGVLNWAGHIIDVLMDGPLDINDYVAREILFGEDKPNRYLRLQPNLSTQYLASLMDSELKQELLNNLDEGEKNKIKRGRIEVIEAIDDASPYNIEVLATLGKAFLKNGAIIRRNPQEQVETASVKEKMLDFIAASR